MRRRPHLVLAALVLAAAIAPVLAQQTQPTTGPGSRGASPDQGFRFTLAPGGADDGVNLQLTGPLRTLFLLTVITFVPAIMMMMTSFTRIVIVLGFVRTALGTQQIPPNQVIVGLSLFLTFFVMAPTLEEINKDALQPYLQDQISFEDATTRALSPLRVMMYRQTRDRDLALMIRMSGRGKPATLADVPTHVLVPAFIISELKTAFEMGFIIYVPFLVIDMVISSTLMSMGMMMLPPVVISMPFKLLLFVLVDGWHLIVRSLVQSFG